MELDPQKSIYAVMVFVVILRKNFLPIQNMDVSETVQEIRTMRFFSVKIVNMNLWMAKLYYQGQDFLQEDLIL